MKSGKKWCIAHLPVELTFYLEFVGLLLELGSVSVGEVGLFVGGEDAGNK